MAKHHHTARIVLFIVALILLFGAYSMSKTSIPSLSVIQPTPTLEPMNISKQKVADFMQSNQNPSAAPTPTTFTNTQIIDTIYKKGSLQSLEYQTRGDVILGQLAENTIVILQSSFATEPGPDLHVYLTKNTTATSREDIKEAVEIGKLEQYNGYQVFIVPANTNLNEFNSITVHCKEFNVPWGFAPLQ
jgi:hypothetical protein